MGRVPKLAQPGRTAACHPGDVRGAFTVGRDERGTRPGPGNLLDPRLVAAIVRTRQAFRPLAGMFGEGPLDDHTDQGAFGAEVLAGLACRQAGPHARGGTNDHDRTIRMGERKRGSATEQGHAADQAVRWRRARRVAGLAGRATAARSLTGTLS